MNTKNVIVITIISIMLIILLIAGFIYYTSDENTNNNNNNSSNNSNNNGSDNSGDSLNGSDIEDDILKKSLVEDISNVYKVDSALKSYYRAVMTSSTNNIISMLHPLYISEEKITTSTLYNFVDAYEKEYTYTISNINTYQIEEGYNVYYVSGILIEDFLDKVEDLEIIEVYNMVYIDETNGTFGIVPITNKEFEEENVNIEETLLKSNDIEKNSYNKYTFTENSDVNLANFYYYNFQQNYKYNSNFLKDNIYIRIDDFEIIYGSSAKSYRIEDDVIEVIDSNNHLYTFEVNGALNYELVISNYENN